MAKKKGAVRKDEDARRAAALLEMHWEEIERNPKLAKDPERMEAIVRMVTDKVLLSKIRDRIKELGMTQAKVAKGIGISQPTLSMFLSGTQGLGIDNFAILLERLDLELAPKRWPKK